MMFSLTEKENTIWISLSIYEVFWLWVELLWMCRMSHISADMFYICVISSPAWLSSNPCLVWRRMLISAASILIPTPVVLSSCSNADMVSNQLFFLSSFCFVVNTWFLSFIICLFICLFIIFSYTCIYVHVCMYLFINILIYLFVCVLFNCSFICLFICIFIYLFIYLFICLFIYYYFLWVGMKYDGKAV